MTLGIFILKNVVFQENNAAARGRFFGIGPTDPLFHQIGLTPASRVPSIPSIKPQDLIQHPFLTQLSARRLYTSMTRDALERWQRRLVVIITVPN